MAKKKPALSIAAYPEEGEWRARNDWECLVSAEKIEGDKARYKAAVAYGRKQLKEAQAVLSENEGAEKKS